HPHRLCRGAAHPAVPALARHRDAEERVGLPVLVPPPARLPHARQDMTGSAALILLRRLASALPSVAGVIIVTFLLTRALPGDPAAYFAGPAATAQAIEEIRHQLGL